MLYVTYALNALLMMALPVALGVFLAGRLKVSWKLFAIGAVTFIASQIIHIPLNAVLFPALPELPAGWRLPVTAILLGLTSGVCEEVARYVVYRWWIKSARAWREGLMFGAGHGGIEAILFGALAGLAFIQLAALRDMDLATLPLTAEQLVGLQKQLTEYWSAPWYVSILGAVERTFTLCFHLSAATMVLQAFTRKNSLWLLAAIVWHAFTNTMAVYLVQTAGIYVTEGAIGLVAIASVGIIFALRRPEPEAAVPVAASPPEAAAPAAIAPPEPSAEKLEETKYQ